ncbi:class I SAM-dependent methyltransferase [Caenimonas aquaedulcis]|uniref:Class I SAM-dependent methyltransferase n=1 Tax=Caenimonas aquaedulcis TaxID=2793270 RepID=A0A931H7K9_9BURK|nr:class I SAM-dependent methyltransferase [Caenimonas aquaedulcis]MBG9389887.1 class I SAM-dependent methyltransferase [Caenimonas aquaedulcis]
MKVDQHPWAGRSTAELDALFTGRQNEWWDEFYANRTRPVPFFGPQPDENLAAWVRDGTLAPGKALDLGSGNGRNAIFLAKSGFDVEGIDYSANAVEWAKQRAREAGANVRFTQASVFDVSIPPASYDLVYDSGCFHHMPPHRRADYIALVAGALKPGGWLGMTCFRPEGGSGLSDEEVYERETLGGGLGYTEARLRELWSGAFTIVGVRQMQEAPQGGGVFGKSFLWTMLARK